MATNPVPDVMRFDALLIRDPQFRSNLASWLPKNKAVHAVRRHNSIPHQHEVDMGIFWQHLGVGRLRRDVGDLTIPTKDAVQRLLGQLGRRALVCWDIFDSDTTPWETVEILQPRPTAYETCLDATKKGTEPRLDWVVFQLLCYRLFNLGR